MEFWRGGDRGTAIRIILKLLTDNLNQAMEQMSSTKELRLTLKGTRCMNAEIHSSSLQTVRILYCQDGIHFRKYAETSLFGFRE